MMNEYTVRLGEITFSYHIDRGNGRFAQSLTMEVSIDILNAEEQAKLKQRIFNLLTEGKDGCVLKEE